MAEKTVIISQQYLKPIKILKWKIREGFSVSVGSVVLVYDFEKVIKKQQHKYKSPRAGTVCKLIAQEGAIIKPGEALFEVEACIHPTVMNDMCADCGADLRKDELNSTASVPMIHSVPELKVSEEIAQRIGKADSERLLKDKKLVLLVDLDQTIIHTTNDIIPPNIKDVYHFQLYGPNSPWYHTRLRPGTHGFLTNISKFFELHICTFGARNYAHRITAILDSDQNLFSNRVLSRDECFNPTSKTANLKALFPCGDHMVCIIDDREDVWSYASNLIHVKPYHFFKHTGDINAPPGLEKHENDEKEGVDLTKIKNRPVEECEKQDVLEIKNEDVTNTGKNEEEKVLKEKDSTLDEVVNNKVNVPAVDNIDKKDNADNINVNGETKTDSIENNSENVEINNTNDKKLEEDIKQNNFIGNNAKEKENIKDQECWEKNDNALQDNGIENNTEEKEKDQEAQENNCIQIQENNIEKNNFTLNSSLNLTEIEDSDDYLLYLEDILKRIHIAFYEEFDQMESGEVPDLKKIIPSVKGRVLKSCKMIFSGLVPTHVQLEHSRAYQVARSLGAQVTPELEDNTTHLVAVRPGTAKVNAGRKRKDLKIVTPDWLWACAERWEHVDEKIFPLSNKGSKNRHPPPHCSSPEHVPNYSVHSTPTSRKRSPSGRFMDTINPLMSFSSAEIADMDKEVEDILDAESESEGEDEDLTEKMDTIDELSKDKEDNSSSSSGESLTAEMPRGHKRNREQQQDEDFEENTKDSDDRVLAKFRRGEELDSDLDIGQDSNSDGSVEAPDEIDDGEWNMMGAALEREFLSNS